MKLLSLIVRLGGVLTHSVPKTRISELELRLLKHIHGADAIAELKQIGEIEISTKDEYRNLARQYGVKAVEQCFDVKLDDFSDWLESQLQAEEEKRFDAQYAQDVPTGSFPPIDLAETIDEKTSLETMLYDGNGEPINPSPEPEPTVEEVETTTETASVENKTQVTLE